MHYPKIILPVPKTYNKTIFVDPNGMNSSALPGRIDKPWTTIGTAIKYLYDNNLTDWTIEVFSGSYSETTNWVIDTQNSNTTIKLNGNVNINSSTGIELCSINNNAIFTIIGDEIKVGNIMGEQDQNLFVSYNSSQINLYNLNLQNLGASYNISYSGSNGACSLFIYNVKLKSSSENIKIISGGFATINANITKCNFITLVNSASGNIDLTSNANSCYSGNWFISQTKFYIDNNDTDIQAHILTDSTGFSPSIWFTWSDLIFYTDIRPYTYMWYDNSNNKSYSANVDIISNVIGNRNTIDSNGCIILDTTSGAGTILSGGNLINNIFTNM
jgi:hypothetical protein